MLAAENRCNGVEAQKKFEKKGVFGVGKRIVILNGSPRKKGNTSMLVKAFAEGAESVGNMVTEFCIR